VDASAAQKQPVNKTCLQCGAILPSGISACRFCDSQFQPKGAPTERASVLLRYVAELTNSNADRLANGEGIRIPPEPSAVSATEPDEPYAWQSELANRVEAYRLRRRKVSPNAAQTSLPFSEPVVAQRATAAVADRATPAWASQATTASIAELLNSAVPEPRSTSSGSAGDDFAFTIAIGRIASEPRTADGRMLIDVSNSSEAEGSEELASELTERTHAGLYPVASLGDRQLAGIIDAACLLFAFGGFVALFGSLGGQLTLSKMSAAVYLTALSVVYFQYFALFTVFGATTPGMMFRGLQVMSFSGDVPTPRQMMLRSAGYMLSAATCFVGFLWALWDEDQLTWHDRLSKTYLSSAQTYAEVESHSAAHR
jgi:uncharacterized RDD family membrane protein YckC/ribosomal protein L40E